MWIFAVFAFKLILWKSLLLCVLNRAIGSIVVWVIHSDFLRLLELLDYQVTLSIVWYGGCTSEDRGCWIIK